MPDWSSTTSRYKKGDGTESLTSSAEVSINHSAL